MRLGDSDRKIDAAIAIRAYQNVVSRGEKHNDAWVLDGLTANTDFDGYSVTLRDDAVTLRVLFHNRVAVDARSGRALETFVRRLRKLAEAH